MTKERPNAIEKLIQRIQHYPAVTVVLVGLGVLAAAAGLISNIGTIERWYEAEFPNVEAQERAQFAAEVADTIEKPWTKKCNFLVPNGWQFEWDAANDNGAISPPSGTAIDRAHFSLSIMDSEGYVAEGEFYQHEMNRDRYNRGFILTRSDQVAALEKLAPKEIEPMTHIVDVPIRFLVTYEDGEGIETEKAEVWKDQSNSYTMSAMVRPTDASEAADLPHEQFSGYREFACSSNADVAVADFGRLCVALLEHTLMTHEVSFKESVCPPADATTSDGDP
jgi:hypothetical protein